MNPSPEKGIKEVRYTFPLYDGVSVVGFTSRIGERVIKGVVKEKEKARAEFNSAVERGETAGLLEQLPDASDVFTTTVGNVPPGASINVEITYLGELKHDAEVDGLRFTIPTFIYPRYGSYPGELHAGNAAQAQGRGGMQVTVDAMLEDGSFIREMRSPSHPIAVTMGNISTAKDDVPTMNKASATLSLGGTELDKDFVVQVIAKEPSSPKVLLESHPFIPRQRALMTTLVPKFSLPPTRPEIVFICDRSGSMGGGKIKTLVSALQVFLKSLPVGVKFNICSFGSRYSFLWPQSKSYSQSSLDEAVKHVESFSADFGGTEMFEPIKATLERRYKDMELEAFLVTDGEIWRHEQLFQYLNKEIGDTGAPIRVFTLGIGNQVSHALIEGIARSGHGFSQAVGENERLDTKVVRMLKAALMPHIKDYSLEIKYGAEKTFDPDDFEVVEKVADSLRIHLDFSDEKESKPKKINPISLFSSSNQDRSPSPPRASSDGQDRYSHLPAINAPKLVQTPSIIPPLFPFTRTTVYLLLSPDTSQKAPKSVVLRGTCPSADGPIPLELEIPIQVLEAPGQTIHQLAAKKAVQELEEGRGWIYSAKDENSGKLIKAVREGRFDEMVEREAVRLGVQFQVGGKWCSFVALEKNDQQDGEDAKMKDKEEYDFLDEEISQQTASTAGSDAYGQGTKAERASQAYGPRALFGSGSPARLARMATQSSGFGSYNSSSAAAAAPPPAPYFQGAASGYTSFGMASAGAAPPPPVSSFQGAPSGAQFGSDPTSRGSYNSIQSQSYGGSNPGQPYAASSPANYSIYGAGAPQNPYAPQDRDHLAARCCNAAS